MMMKQGKLRFLSARILCVIIGLIVVIGILSLLLLFDSFKESSVNVVILAFCIGLTLLLCCFFWKMIVKPFNQMEKNLGLFLDGYTTSHLMGEDNIFYISPAYEGVITKIQYMLQSQELLNLNKRQAQYLALQNQINPHFLYNTLEGIRGEVLLHALEGEGILVSTGSACSSHAHRASGVLVSQGVTPARAGQAIRISLSVITTQEEIDTAIEIIRAQVTRLARFKRR